MRFATLLRERSPRVGPARVEVISSGPDCEGDPLWETYVKLFSNCKRSITVVTPYFVPDRTLFTLLVTAAHAGRHVKIMVPRRSDHRLLDLARRWYLRNLREAGAEIHFFKPDVLHAKLVIVDEEQLVVGSANLDMRSLFLNYEIVAVVRDPVAAAEVGALAARGRATDDVRVHAGAADVLAAAFDDKGLEPALAKLLGGYAAADARADNDCVGLVLSDGLSLHRCKCTGCLQGGAS